MQKIILLFLITLSLNGMGGFTPNITVVATDVKNKITYIDNNNPMKVCGNFRSESERYFLKGNQAANRNVAWRYLDIANNFANQYGNCVKSYNNNVKYQGYVPNQYK